MTEHRTSYEHTYVPVCSCGFRGAAVISATAAVAAANAHARRPEDAEPLPPEEQQECPQCKAHGILGCAEHNPVLVQARERIERLREHSDYAGRQMLVHLRSYSDTYYTTVIAEKMMATPEMRGLRELARSKGFRIDVQSADTIEDMERFLEQLAT